MAGLTYFNFKGFPDDTSTSGNGLTRKQIDLNFYNLKKTDIKDAEWDNKERRIVINTLGGDKFYVDNLDPYKFVYDEEARKLSATTVDGKQVAIITKVTTDESLDGDGSIADPIRLNFSSKSGYYKPVQRVIDTIPAYDSVEGLRYVLKQKENASGKLYTKEEIKLIADYLKAIDSPWRVATKEDWDAMLNSIDPCVFVEGAEYPDHTELGYCGHNAGNVLKDDLLWYGSDSFDFSAVPTRNLSAVYGMFDKDGKFYEKHILDDTNQILTVEGNEDDLYSIRFIKDNDYQIYENILNDDYSCIKMPYIKDGVSGYTIWTKNNAYTENVNGISVGADIANGVVIDRYYLIQYDAFDNKWMMHPMDIGEHFFAIEDNMEYRVMFDMKKGGYYLGSVADLIQSSMIKSDYDHDKHQLILEFETNVGHQQIAIDLGELIDIYDGDNATIVKRGNIFSAIMDVPGGVMSFNKFVKLQKDLQNSIDKASSDLIKELEETANALQENIDNVDDKVDENYKTFVATAKDLDDKINKVNKDIKDTVKKGLEENKEAIKKLHDDFSDFQTSVNESLADLESKVKGDVSNQIEALSGALTEHVDTMDEFRDSLETQMSGISQEVREKDYVIARALNDLNQKYWDLRISKLDKDVNQTQMGNIYTSLEDIDANIQNTKDELLSGIGATNAVVASNKADIEALSGAMADYTAETQTVLDDLKNNVTGPVSKELSELKETVKTNKEESDKQDNELRDSINELEKQIEEDIISGLTELKETIDETIANDISALEETDMELRDMIANIESASTEYTDTMARALNEDIEALEDRVEVTENGMDVIADTVDQLTNNIVQLEENIQDALAMVESAATSYTDEKVAELQETLDDNYYTKKEIGGEYTEDYTVAQNILDTKKVSAYALHDLRARLQLLADQIKELQEELGRI